MSRRLLIINTVLVLALISAGMKLRQLWLEAKGREQAILAQRAKPLPPPAVPAAPGKPAITPASYLEVAQKMLFSKDRNPDVVIEAIRGYAGNRLDLRPLDLGMHDLSSSAGRRAAIEALIARLKYLDQQERDRTVAAVLRCAGVPRPRELMMSTADVRTLRSAGMDVGAHTHTHPILARISVADAERDKIQHVCKRAYRALELSGLARIDLRLDPSGQVWVIEANPNPQIAKGEDFAASAEKAGINYETLLQRILNLGLRWQPESVA